MKNIKNINFKIIVLLGCIVFAATSCERGYTDDVSFALFPNNSDIYLDGFTGGLDYYPYSDSKPDVFSVDTETKYSGASAMRFDIPNVGDPGGPYGGASFILGDIEEQTSGRNLSEYDALTFYAKATQSATLDNVGFGQDFGENKYEVTLQNVPLTTNWVKYIIPIPDASKLIQERGMFWYSEGPENGEGYTFWVDELQFETLGTIGQPRPAVLGGQDQTAQANVGTSISISGLTYTANQANGQDITINVAPSYFDFETSNPFVASVDESGLVTVEGPGIDGDNTSVIKATLGGVEAAGSLIIESSDINVQSIFSNTFGNIGGLNIGAFNNPDIVIELQSVGNEETILYGDLGFVGMSWDSSIDVSDMTHVHIDVQLQSAGSSLNIELIDFGPDDTDNGLSGTDGTAGGFNATDQLVQGEWVGIDIPLNAFTLPTGGGGSGSPNLNNLGYFVLVSNNGTVLIDNIYFYN